MEDLDNEILDQEIIEVIWTGPYSWPKFEHQNGLLSIPRQPGVYLQTFEYKGGYLIYAAGLTRRPIPVRFREHTRNYMNGEYNVLDVGAIQQGFRKEVWHGWGWSPEKQIEFEKHKSAIHNALHKQLAEFRIFVAEVGTQIRVLERLEAAIMITLYEQPSPFCDIPDKGMMLAPRWDSEKPILTENKVMAKLYGIPLRLEI
ncbi:MAG TPA: hypothetical protein PLD25_29645 [Chloroflexota bacterium]|nr:hypothetical protein [Chloroflexota bacterium]HUM67268.1 hypothetical protein [Chloroflexota bacterium]